VSLHAGINLDVDRNFLSRLRDWCNQREMTYDTAARGRRVYKHKTMACFRSSQSKMAGASDWFTIGSTVACKTCHEQEIEGEVQAFDPQTKMLVLSILLIAKIVSVVNRINARARRHARRTVQCK